MTDRIPNADMPYFCSWSGGKDACLALYRAWKGTGGISGAGKPRYLLTSFEEDGSRSRGHGIPLDVLQRQAACLSVPLLAVPTSWDGYEDNFRAAIRSIAGEGVAAGVYGDIELEAHREWVTRVTAAEGMRAFLPLWLDPRRVLLTEFLTAGFTATIVAVKDERLGPAWLGRVLDEAIIGEFEALGVDACGEDGEFHTLVTNGPVFERPLTLETGSVVERDGSWVLEVL